MDKDKNTEEKILESAKKVFIRKGLAASRMQEIADEAGINKALLHYYFRSKDKLYDAVVQSALKNFFPRLIGILDSAQSIPRKLELISETYINLSLENPYLPAFIIGEINQDPVRIFGLFENISVAERIKNLQNQVDEESNNGFLNRFDVRQMIVSIIAMCVFPFAAKPMVVKLFGVEELEFRQFIEERKGFIKQVINKSLKVN